MAFKSFFFVLTHKRTEAELWEARHGGENVLPVLSETFAAGRASHNKSKQYFHLSSFSLVERKKNLMFFKFTQFIKNRQSQFLGLFGHSLRQCIGVALTIDQPAKNTRYTGHFPAHFGHLFTHIPK